MKTINLYFDFQFTSLSPDAKPISLGIVSDELLPDTVDFKSIPIDKLPYHTKEALKDINPKECIVEGFDFVRDDLVINLGVNGFKEKFFVPPSWIETIPSKYFYAEFSDFDLNRCDDWVKKNVLKKLFLHKDDYRGKYRIEADYIAYGDIDEIREFLFKYLAQFSDYQIQFIMDCGTWDWYWLVQLLAEWDSRTYKYSLCSETEQHRQSALREGRGLWTTWRTGLPKLPDNISPVPFDLNDLIAIKKGITPKEAFDLNREELFNKEAGWLSKEHQKHNALWDAKVIKEIYQKLK